MELRGVQEGRIVAEANNGGDMVAETLRAVAPEAPVMLVRASRGKAARAEPVACRFENGEAWFAGAFPELEDELCTLSPDKRMAPQPGPSRCDCVGDHRLVRAARGAARAGGVTAGHCPAAGGALTAAE